MALEITRVETVAFTYELEDVGTDQHGFNQVYEPGSTYEGTSMLVRIHTDAGITGESLQMKRTPVSAEVASYLVGKDPLRRERHWSELKRALRHSDGSELAPVDIALWDIAGKHYDAPIHELLGTYRERLPAYASTPHGDENGGLDSPEAYADFAEQCLGLGYPAFKVHGWGPWRDKRDIDREVETVLAVGERVGDEMDLMLDPANEYETFGDALTVGEACDEAGFFWYEDPYRDTGKSQYSHRKLRQSLDTSILATEHVPGLEPHADFVATEATDFVRGDLWHGITGLMKVAHAAESFGIDVEPHGAGPAMRHCMAAIRNANYYEMALVHPEWDHSLSPLVYEDYADRLDSIDADGTVGLPDGPGLGVTIDEGYVEDRSIRRETYE